MKLIKKLTMLCIALVGATSFAAVAACELPMGGNSSSSSSTDESSSVESSSSVEDSSSEDNIPENAEWNDWVRTKDPTCSEEGEKTRTLIDDPTKTQTAKIPARGHEYAWDSDSIELAGGQGICIHCKEAATIPSLDANVAFPLVDICTHTDEEIYEELCNCEYKGRGEAYSRIELFEDCYTIEIPASEKVWLSFSVESAGQYVLYSVDGDNDVVAKRYNAESHYVNEYGGLEADVQEDNFYSYVNCGETYFSSQWRATYTLEGAEGTMVKICFARIADPTWVPKTITSMVYATEINGVKAPSGKEGEKLVASTFDDDYFYDETVGYYRRGTKNKPGEILYAAITKKAERLFGDRSFIDAFQGFGAVLYLNDGANADGDIISRCYIPFLSNCADDNNHNNGETDPEKNCYMNYVNADGVYPVTKELYEFLNLYVRANQPIGSYDYGDEYKAELARDWREHRNEDGADANKNRFWLAACYYYKTTAFGVADNPLVLQEGNNEITIPKREHYYATVENGTYKIVCDNADMKVYLGTETFEGPIDLVVNGTATLRFSLGSNGGSATISVTKIDEEGSEGFTLMTAKPATLGEITLKTQAIYAADGSVEYIGYYAYTPTAEGTFTFTLTDDTTATVMVGNNASVTNNNPTTSVTVTATQIPDSDDVTFETLYLYVTTEEPAEITATLAFA